MIMPGRREVLAAAAAFIALGWRWRALADVAGAAWHDRKRYQDVFGQQMAYYEVGSGRPIIFLHGNPTSSYLWHNIIPYVQGMGRCIAPDLIGMGDSAKLPNSGPGVYTYATHRRYLRELFRQLGLDRDIVLVLHDWGTVLGFDFAAHNPQAIRGIAYMEAFMQGPRQEWRPHAAAGAEGGRTVNHFKERIRSAEGERMILEENQYIERVIAGLNGYLTKEDEAEYRRPYLQPGESRRPILEWTKGQSPVVSKENFETIRAYCAWLAGSVRVPKLFIHAVPGAIMPENMQRFALSLPNQKVVDVPGRHFIQETAPDMVGRALADWLARLP